MDAQTAIEWLRRDVAAVSNASTDENGHIIVLRQTVQAALDHIAALEAENARMRAVVERLAHTPGRLTCYFRCRINERWHELHPAKWNVHSPECLVSQARAVLDNASALKETSAT